MPELRLLDARVEGLDDVGLRARARELTDASGATHAARSYRFPWALLAWHDGPVGVDLELIGPRRATSPSRSRRPPSGSSSPAAVTSTAG